MRYQRTIQQTVTCSGIGLHTGQAVTIRLHQAAEDHGIVFLRTDLARPVAIRAVADHVISTTLSTSLGRGGVTVQTVEHLLAACAGLRIDNLLVEVDGPEVPILDGSAAPFVALLREAGVKSQSRLQPYMRLIRPIQVGAQEHGVTLLPAPFPKISYSINFPDAVVKRQEYHYHGAEEEFVQQIAPARTFGFLKDVERMRAMGLIKGGSLENAIVIGEEGVMNPEGLRFPDEFVRHKVLDLIGDTALIGCSLVAHMVAASAGHAVNLDLVRHLLDQPDAWVMVAPEEQRWNSVEAAPLASPFAASLPL
jgi:UDP-3-O-[3-hydroxymyristoyl] N-acetylglucosamine deacetylase